MEEITGICAVDDRYQHLCVHMDVIVNTYSEYVVPIRDTLFILVFAQASHPGTCLQWTKVVY